VHGRAAPRRERGGGLDSSAAAARRSGRRLEAGHVGGWGLGSEDSFQAAVPQSDPGANHTLQPPLSDHIVRSGDWVRTRRLSLRLQGWASMATMYFRSMAWSANSRFAARLKGRPQPLSTLFYLAAIQRRLLGAPCPKRKRCSERASRIASETLLTTDWWDWPHAVLGTASAKCEEPPSGNSLHGTTRIGGWQPLRMMVASPRKRCGFHFSQARSFNETRHAHRYLIVIASGLFHGTRTGGDTAKTASAIRNFAGQGVSLENRLKAYGGRQTASYNRLSKAELRPQRA